MTIHVSTPVGDYFFHSFEVREVKVKESSVLVKLRLTPGILPASEVINDLITIACTNPDEVAGLITDAIYKDKNLYIEANLFFVT